MRVTPVFESCTFETDTHHVQVFGTASPRKPGFVFLVVNKAVNPDGAISLSSYGGVSGGTTLTEAVEKLRSEFK